MGQVIQLLDHVLGSVEIDTPADAARLVVTSSLPLAVVV